MVSNRPNIRVVPRRRGVATAAARKLDLAGVA